MSHQPPELPPFCHIPSFELSFEHSSEICHQPFDSFRHLVLGVCPACAFGKVLFYIMRHMVVAQNHGQTSSKLNAKS